MKRMRRLPGRPAEVVVQASAREQPLEPSQPRVAVALELDLRQPGARVGARELFDPAARVPAQLQPGERPRELAEVDAVAARVGLACAGVLDSAVGNDLFDD